MIKDLIVIGGGPGGYVAAIRAAQLGAKVLLIEQDKIGGTCLNRGCIPTKALYRNAQMLNYLKGISEFGITLEGYSFDVQAAQKRKQDIVDRLQGGIDHLLKSFGIEVISGRGTLIDKSTVEITTEDGHQVQQHAKNILLATGSETSTIPVPGIELPGVITSDQALELDYVPSEMVIIGGGVVGIEFAGIYSSFGTQVTVVELLGRILPTVDEEIVKRLTPLLKKKGIKIETSVVVKEIIQEAHGYKVLAEGKQGSKEYSGELILVSAGRKVNTKNLNLSEIGIAYDQGGIKVNSQYCTSVPGIYAIGDVIGGKMLAHVASEQGRTVVENIFGTPSQINNDAIPACIFSFPEMASVGLTEEEAKQREIPYSVSKFMFAANGKALTMGETNGLVKVIAEENSKKILGVHILGAHASDLIHEGVLAIQHGLSAQQVSHAIHAHPTLAESFQEAVFGLDDQAIHMIPTQSRMLR